MKKAIISEKAPKAIGPYSHAVQVGDLYFLSGQTPAVPATGKLAEGGIKEQTVQVFENIKAVLESQGMDMTNIVKTTVFLDDMSLFKEMNEVYATYFEGDYPARSAFAVKGLPMGALVEIQCVATK